MRAMVKTVTEAGSPDPEGNLIDRFWAEIEKAKGDPNGVFHGDTGRKLMFGSTMDIFIAGKMQNIFISVARPIL